METTKSNAHKVKNVCKVLTLCSVVLIVMVTCIATLSPEPSKTPETIAAAAPTPETDAENVSMTSEQINDVFQRTFDELVQRMFNPKSGECYILTKLIKRSLFEPDSYRHVSTHSETIDNDGYFLVTTVYKAKALNDEFVKCFVQAKVYFDEETIEILNESN